MKHIVKLRFKAFGNVRNYTNDEDNWPGNWSDMNTDHEREIQEFREFYRRNTPGRAIQMPIEDPSGEFNDLTGHPAARGCKSCRRYRRHCSMVKDGIYPCFCCTEDSLQCAPILVSAVKGRCEQCIEDGEDLCSFEDDPHQTTCDRCIESGHICEALPPGGYKADRIDIYDIIGGEDRRHVQCSTCRQEKKRCSLRKKSDYPPCNYCRRHGIGCTFFDLPNVDSQVRREGIGEVRQPTESEAPEVAVPGSNYFTSDDLADLIVGNETIESRSPTPEIEMEDHAGHKGGLTKIRTSFAHPIQFCTQVDGDSDCNFCEMPLFGMAGHFEREVHVIRWYNGLGFSEIGGGHCEENGHTRMCETCTITRLQTLVCPKHKIQRIISNGSVQDFYALADELISAKPGSSEMRRKLQRWCSMCFSEASFGCSSIQPSLHGEEEMEIQGCGFKLCDRCETTLREVFNGDADLLASEMEKVPKISMADERSCQLEGKARADVGFLRKGGLLMNNIIASEGS